MDGIRSVTESKTKNVAEKVTESASLGEVHRSSQKGVAQRVRPLVLDLSVSRMVGNEYRRSAPLIIEKYRRSSRNIACRGIVNRKK